MANFLTVSLLITLAAPLILSAAAKKPELATEVCKNTTDFAFCRAAIYSDHRAPNADRYELIDIAFRKAFLNASDTRDYIASKIKSGGGGKSDNLKKCLGNYKKAVQILAEMLDDLNSETYYELDVRSLDVERSVRACKKGLHGPSPITKRNDNMLKLANICYVVSKLFEYH